MSEEFIERRIVTGLIVSTEYIQEIEPIWSPKYLEIGRASCRERV